jgi:hypothetical protein
MNSPIIAMIEEAIDAVEKSIVAHKSGVQAPLSLTMLLRVRAELENMRKHLSPKSYAPSYQRFVMDWPDETGLVKKLMSVAYEYNKVKG